MHTARWRNAERSDAGIAAGARCWRRRNAPTARSAKLLRWPRSSQAMGSAALAARDLLGDGDVGVVA